MSPAPGPRPGLGLVQGMRQQMLLQPRMLQSIEVLQLHAGDLEAWLARQAEGNEALVVVPSERSSAASMAATEAHDAALQNHEGRPEPVGDRALRQLNARAEGPDALAPDLLDWARFLVGSLDPSGFLSATDEELLERARDQGLSGAGSERAHGLLAAGIATLQELEPRGLGARDAIEALLLQLDPTDPDYFVLCRLLEDFVEELAAGKARDVAAALELDTGDLERLLGTLATLDLRPAADPTADSGWIQPDLVVLPQGDAFELSLVRGHLPDVQIDPAVEELARDPRSDASDRRYLRGKVEKARWIQEAIAQRGETLLRVATFVFERQLAFLTEGPLGLAPLRMGDAAEELGLATSTVSRAVAHKHVQTPWGIHPLRSFFQNSASEDGGGPARGAVAERIRDLVGAEDPGAPLSDDALVARLLEEGTKVARRTVAKYRKELGIPSSYQRRRGA